jgi:hypothetical protein
MHLAVAQPTSVRKHLIRFCSSGIAIYDRAANGPRGRSLPGRISSPAARLLQHTMYISSTQKNSPLDFRQVKTRFAACTMAYVISSSIVPLFFLLLPTCLMIRSQHRTRSPVGQLEFTYFTYCDVEERLLFLVERLRTPAFGRLPDVISVLVSRVMSFSARCFCASPDLTISTYSACVSCEGSCGVTIR